MDKGVVFIFSRIVFYLPTYKWFLQLKIHFRRQSSKWTKSAQFELRLLRCCSLHFLRSSIKWRNAHPITALLIQAPDQKNFYLRWPSFGIKRYYWLRRMVNSIGEYWLMFPTQSRFSISSRQYFSTVCQNPYSKFTKTARKGKFHK